MTDTAEPADRSSTNDVARPAIWAAVAMAGLLALWQGAPLTALCAAAAIVLACGPRAFTAASGLRFPPWTSTGVLLFTAAALLLGEMGGLYVTTAWFDVVLHLVAAVVLAQVGWALVLMLTAGGPPAVPLWVGSVLAFAFAMMVGGLWEVLEFSIDRVFGTNTQRSGIPDTMTDLIADAVGGAWGAVAVQRGLSHGRAWIGGGMVAEWMRLNPVLYGRAALPGPQEGRDRPLPRQDRALERRG